MQNFSSCLNLLDLIVSLSVCLSTEDGGGRIQTQRGWRPKRRRSTEENEAHPPGKAQGEETRRQAFSQLVFDFSILIYSFKSASPIHLHHCWLLFLLLLKGSTGWRLIAVASESPSCLSPATTGPTFRPLVGPSHPLLPPC